MSVRTIWAPKNLQKNLEYRKTINKLALESKAAKEEIWIAASRDIVWFLDTFGWTFSPKDFPDSPDRPFITWPFQEETLARISSSIGQKDVLIEKSRDMGATWMVEAILFHRWLFKKRQTFLCASRKQEYVDQKGDPDCLFWKFDYLLSNLPTWMQPSVHRVDLHLGNEENGSTIDGESTNGDLGRGGRRTAIFLDEFAAVENGGQILSATRDATNCRLFVSTPKGSMGAYYDQRVKMKAESPEQIITLHWRLHPLKAKGLYYVDGKPRSPWYDKECLRAAHPQEIAQQLDIDYVAAAWQFFEQDKLQELSDRHATDPVFSGELDFDYEDIEPTWIPIGDGRVKIWCPLSAEGLPPKGEYVVGCDVATGKGGEMSSQSVATIANKNTGEMAGMFASNHIAPNDFGRYAVALCKFFHGAKLIWEANGPGGEFGTAVWKSGYRNIYYRKDESSISNKATTKPGWWSGPDAKRNLLSRYKEALLQGRFINRSRESLMECGQYAHQPNQTIEHNRALASSDPTAKAANHGDCVISAALANLLLTSEAKGSKINAEPIILPGSIAYRIQEHEREVRKKAYY